MNHNRHPQSSRCGYHRWTIIAALAIMLSALIGCSLICQRDNNTGTAIVFECGWSWEIKHGEPWRLCIIDTSVSRWSTITDTEHLLLAPISVSPSGQQVTFSDYHEYIDDGSFTKHSIMSVDESGSLSELVHSGSALSWSPDGNAFVFLNIGESTTSIDLIEMDGEKQTTLVDEFHGDLDFLRSPYWVRIEWSPDGEAVVYDYPTTDGGSEIHIYRLSSGISEFLAQGRNPSWSPDGHEIAFGRGDAVWKHSMETGVEELLVTIDGQVEWPSWSPSGDEIVFVRSTANKSGNLRILNLADNMVRQLTVDSSWEMYPVWVELSDKFIPTHPKTLDNR